jgi:uncharacterized protein (DUF2235 family)
MKNIVVCCDGTSNDFGNHNSNVVKIFNVLEKNTPRQATYYDPGVGTPSTYDAFNPVTRKIQYVLGQSFGYGLNQNIMDAYAFLMKTYEEGDRLYFFGFSRGAYTVRALAGLINTCGLLYAHSENLIAETMRIYHDRKAGEIAVNFKKTFSRNCTIHFLGLWDTVSSVGWVYNPVTLQGTSNNESVVNVRHAIAIDERRAFFRQNLWGSRFEKQQDIRQVWFSGVHSDVGGSYPENVSNLSNISLEWMIVEAMGKGLLFDEEKLETIKSHLQKNTEPYLQDLNVSLSGGWLIAEYWPKLIRVNKGSAHKPHWVSRLYVNKGRYRFMDTRYRHCLHESVLLRLQKRADYRPANLLKICPDPGDFNKHFDIEKWNRL